VRPEGWEGRRVGWKEGDEKLCFEGGFGLGIEVWD